MRPRERAVGTMNTLLRSMGHSVESLDEFFDHFSSGRVVVQANGTPEDPTKGHAAFFYKNGIYELKVGPDQYLENVRHKARYPYEKGAGEGVVVKYRAFIEKTEPKTFSRCAQTTHLIEKGRLFVLDDQYSRYFERAFEKERSNFVKMPYSYGVHYNCNTFALFTIKRLLELKHADANRSRSLLERHAQYRRSRTKE